MNKPNPVVHFEIGCRDNGKSSAFYAELFGWGVEQRDPTTYFKPIRKTVYKAI